MTDLEDKDREIDSLLDQADDLVEELKKSLSRVSASMRKAAGGEDWHDNAG